MVMSTRRFRLSSPRFGMSKSGRFPSSSSVTLNTVSFLSSTRRPAEFASALTSAYIDYVCSRHGVLHMTQAESMGFDW